MREPGLDVDPVGAPSGPGRAGEKPGLNSVDWISRSGPVAVAPLLGQVDRDGYSRMHEVIIRPDAYQEQWLAPERRFDWRGGTVTIFDSGEGRAAFVAMEDVAEAVVRLAMHPNPPRIVELGGPETMSRNELVAAFEQRLGRPIRRQRLPRAVMRALSLALRPVHPGLASVMGMSVRSDARRSAPDDHAFRELGIEPRPVSAYIDELTAAYLREPGH